MLTIGWLLMTVATPRPAARAELSWETREVNLGLLAVAKVPGVLEARFPFTNAGQSAVEIRTLHTSCACTVAELSKRRYEPGERGEILLRFEPGERVGPQEKLLTVETSDDDPTTGPAVLRLRAEIPEVARLRPAFVFWTQGEAPGPKVLRLEAPGGNLGEVRVESSTPEMTVECRATEPGWRWELLVRPAGGTARSLIATLHVRCRFTPPAGEGGDNPGGTPFERTFKAYAAVKPPAAPPVAANQR